MDASQIRLIYEFYYWANHRILDTCARVSEEQYISHSDAGGLRIWLVHLVDAERQWRHLCQEIPVPAELTETDLPTLDALKQSWAIEEHAMRAYLDTLTDQDLSRTVRYTLPSGTVRERILWQCLYHLANHGTQHR